jgi:hypothetical protein
MGKRWENIVRRPIGGGGRQFAKYPINQASLELMVYGAHRNFAVTQFKALRREETQRKKKAATYAAVDPNRRPQEVRPTNRRKGGETAVKPPVIVKG